MCAQALSYHILLRFLYPRFINYYLVILFGSRAINMTIISMRQRGPALTNLLFLSLFLSCSFIGRWCGNAGLENIKFKRKWDRYSAGNSVQHENDYFSIFLSRKLEFNKEG